MILYVALAFLWLAALYPVVVSLTRKREVWRTAFTLSVISAASAITLWVFRSQIDAWLGVWNVANLASHCVWVIGNGLTLISLEGMKQAQLSRRLVKVHLGAASVAVAMMIICWWRAPIQSQFHEDLAPLADNLALTLYYGIFYGFMGWCLARAAWFCLGSRLAFRRADPARGASLLIIGFASIGGLAVIALYFASILARFLRGREASELTRLGNVILPGRSSASLLVCCLLSLSRGPSRRPTPSLIGQLFARSGST